MLRDLFKCEEAWAACSGTVQPLRSPCPLQEGGGVAGLCDAHRGLTQKKPPLTRALWRHTPAWGPFQSLALQPFSWLTIAPAVFACREADEEEANADLGAFQREYEDDHSWEALQEDEFGRLRPLVPGPLRAGGGVLVWVWFLHSRCSTSGLRLGAIETPPLRH